MIIANFNVENLFERARAMNMLTWREGELAINAAGELNAQPDEMQAQVRSALQDLSEICEGEYGMSLEALLLDDSREAALRLQRVTGIALKPSDSFIASAHTTSSKPASRSNNQATTTSVRDPGRPGLADPREGEVVLALQL